MRLQLRCRIMPKRRPFLIRLFLMRLQSRRSRFRGLRCLKGSRWRPPPEPTVLQGSTRPPIRPGRNHPHRRCLPRHPRPGQRPERLLKANPPRPLRGTPPSRQRQTPPSRLLMPPLLLPILMLPHSRHQPVRGILPPHQRHTLLLASPPHRHHQEDHPPPAADHPPTRSPEAARSGAVPTIWRSRRSPACLRPCATVWREEWAPQGTLSAPRRGKSRRAPTQCTGGRHPLSRSSPHLSGSSAWCLSS